ncbi:MAG: hypothetical protein AAFV88_02595 [Planctomycetota bacterium]
MDGIIEPVVLVLGHPIAGNPSQFALERAFESLSLPWRVLSFDVSPTDLETAISGARVLGVRAILMDQNVLGEDADDGRPHSTDLLFRNDPTSDTWQRCDLATEWLQREICGTLPPPVTEPPENTPPDDSSTATESAKPQSEPAKRTLLWIGEPDPRFPAGIANQESKSPIAWASESSIEQADVIAISDQIDVTQWPNAQGQTVVVDFANPPNQITQLRERGYALLGREAMRIGTLQLAIERMAGIRPDLDVLAEAVEEYLAV